jgi:hypothetical protein
VLAASTRDGRLIAWQTETGIFLAPFLFRRDLDASPTEFRADQIQAVALSPDGKALFALTGARRPTLRHFEVATGQERASVVVDLRDRSRLAVSPDGRAVVVWGRSRHVFLWDVLAGGPIRRCFFAEDDVSTVAFSSDGRLVAVGTVRGDVQLWSMADGKERGRFQGHADEIRSLAFAPDDRTLASGSADLTALLWTVGDALRNAEAPSAPEMKLTAKELEERWNQLLEPEAWQSHAAIVALLRAPGQAVPLLREHVRPLKLEPDHIDRLIADLDSNKFAVRQKAAADLEELRWIAEPALRKALAEKPSLELQRRIEKLLEKLAGPRLRGEGLRSWRAVEVLEGIGTAEARQVLEKLAQGTPGFPLTDEARASVERLKGRGAK